MVHVAPVFVGRKLIHYTVASLVQVSVPVVCRSVGNVCASPPRGAAAGCRNSSYNEGE
jgi:hypothetical protein